MSTITVVVFGTVNTFRTNRTLFNLAISLESLQSLLFAKQKLSKLLPQTDLASSTQFVSENLIHKIII